MHEVLATNLLPCCSTPERSQKQSNTSTKEKLPQQCPRVEDAKMQLHSAPAYFDTSSPRGGKDTCTSSSTTNYALIDRGSSNPTSSMIDWTDEQQTYTKSTTTMDIHHKQMTPDNRLLYLAQHPPRFAILRYGFFLPIQHIEFFQWRLPPRVPGKCKRWRLRYYEY